MVFSLIDYTLVLVLLFYGFTVRWQNPASYNTQLISLYILATAFVSLGIGGAYHAALALLPPLSVLFGRVAASATVASHLLLGLLAISFPYERRLRILRYLALAVWLAASYGIFFTEWYLVSMSWVAGSLLRETGPIYLPVTVGGFSLGILSALTLVVRRFFFKSKIFKLQTLMVIFGLLGGYVVSFTVAIVLPFGFDMSWTYALMPLGAALLAAVMGYGVSITRLFDVRTVVSAALSFLGFSLLLAALSGAGFGWAAIYLRQYAGWTAAALGFGVYLLTWLAGALLKVRFRSLVRGGDSYGEKLEARLSAMDYSLGRAEVIAELLRSLRDAIGCTGVDLFIADDEGRLLSAGTTVHAGPDRGAPPALESKSRGIEVLINNNAPVLLKTEIVVNHEYHEVKDELLALLDRFDADALVLLREGRALIGMLFFGVKRTGADYTNYDYQTLQRIYGKLFVSAYYLKNVAQESLVVTVDRELDFSDQIIQSIQENLDRVEHPGVDISFLTKSTRKLGGDFIDFIKLSGNRYLLVLGDVSGKGLNASMSMVILKSIIRTFLHQTKDFKEVVVRTNSFIKEHLPRGTFFAGVFGLFDFDTRTVHYVNCGVPVMYLLSSAYNNPVEIQGAGKVLGFVKDIRPHLTVRKTVFKPGDLLFTATDGLTEAESLNGRRFGKEGIQRSLGENRNAPAARMVQFMRQDLETFVSGEINDDITLLVIKFR